MKTYKNVLKLLNRTSNNLNVFMPLLKYFRAVGQLGLLISSLICISFEKVSRNISAAAVL